MGQHLPRLRGRRALTAVLLLVHAVRLVALLRRREELQRYVEDTIDHFGIRDRFRFSTAVETAVWDQDRAAYRVRTRDGEEHLFSAVVSCVGFLNRPRYPDWPGLGTFAGPKFHTARWEPEHDLAGRTVALVGTGSTAIQITAKLAEVAKHVDVYQREPGWIFPSACGTTARSAARSAGGRRSTGA